MTSRRIPAVQQNITDDIRPVFAAYNEAINEQHLLRFAISSCEGNIQHLNARIAFFADKNNIDAWLWAHIEKQATLLLMNQLRNTLKDKEHEALRQILLARHKVVIGLTQTVERAFESQRVAFADIPRDVPLIDTPPPTAVGIPYVL